MPLIFALFTTLLTLFTLPAEAADIRLLVTGASKVVVTELAEDFARKAGHKVIITADTAGGVAKRVESGEAFEIGVTTRGVIDSLIGKGKLAVGSRGDIASTSVGVAIKEGAAKPDISTLAAFRQTLLNAKTIAYVDPASGGTSGIYIASVIEKMGLTDTLKPKLRLLSGGFVAELVAKGEAEIAIHQISEILPVKGVTMIGEIPAEIQIVTTYSGGLAPQASDAAKALLAYITGRRLHPSWPRRE